MATVETPLEAYVAAARRRMANLDGPGESTWRDIVERGLGEAYANGDFAGLTFVIQLLVNLLESQARIPEAVEEIDHGLRFVRIDPSATASLEALKAPMLAMLAEADEALELAGRARENAAAHLTGERRAKAFALTETARFMGLAGPTPAYVSVADALMHEHRPLDHLYVLSWQLAFMATAMETEETRPLVRSFRAITERERSRFRGLEAPVFERWLAIVGNTQMPAREPGDGFGATGRGLGAHPLAAWRTACLDFHQALAQRNWAAATIALQSIDRRRTRPGSDTGMIAPFEALYAAVSGEGEVPEITPPPVNRVVLTNLAAAISGAHAVALAGSHPQALLWLDWVTKARRRGIESCLEAPVSLHRLQGLLALRAGKLPLARKSLDLAARRAAEGGRVVEAALARLQAEELKAKTASPGDGTLVAARRRVAELGIDPVPHLYAVHNASDAAAAASPRPLLTPRETEVLRELALGHSYKGVAQDLGISWTTVQTLSHRVYNKLSVSNRVEAIAAGQKLGLL